MGLIVYIIIIGLFLYTAVFLAELKDVLGKKKKVDISLLKPSVVVAIIVPVFFLGYVLPNVTPEGQYSVIADVDGQYLQADIDVFFVEDEVYNPRTEESVMVSHRVYIVNGFKTSSGEYVEVDTFEAEPFGETVSAVDNNDEWYDITVDDVETTTEDKIKAIGKFDLLLYIAAEVLAIFYIIMFFKSSSEVE